MKTKHTAWLEKLETEGVNLTTWETEFIESIRAWLDRGRTLTEKQATTLEDIYAKRTP